jgi:hypothetical protein
VTQEHSITPPPELVQQWEEQWCDMPVIRPSINSYMAAQAAQWGADQELEASLEWLVRKGYLDARRSLPDARRPKPPSRKEQALEAIGRLCASVIHDDLKNDAAIVLRALEALDD